MEATKIQISDLSTYHRNARRGNVKAIAESLEVNGQYKPIIVNRGTKTGRPMEVIVGNHTMEAAKQIGLTELDAVLIDEDEDAVTRIVVADNRTSDLADYDNDLLLGLIDDLPDLSGTGFTDEDLDALEALTYTHDDGPRDLDELHEKVGSPTDADKLMTVKLELDPEVADRLLEVLGDDHNAGILELLGGSE